MLKTSRLIRDVSREAVSCFTRVFRKTFSLMDNTMFFFCIWIQHVHTISLPPLSVMQLFVDTLYTNIGKSFWKKKLIFSQFACIECEVVDCSCGRVSNICCFTCLHMKVILIRTGEKLQNFRWCSVFTTFWAGRDLYRATRIGTQNLGFTVSTEKKPRPLFSRLQRRARDTQHLFDPEFLQVW